MKGGQSFMKSVQLSPQGVSKFSFHWKILGRTVINPHAECKAPTSSNDLRKFVMTGHPTSACCKSFAPLLEGAGAGQNCRYSFLSVCESSPPLKRQVMLQGRIHQYIADDYFFLFLLLKSWDKTLLHPCAREEYRLGAHMLLLPRLFSTSLALHRSFSRQQPRVHSSREIMYEQIHSSSKIILNWWWNCPLSNAEVVSSSARTQVSLFV